MPSKDEAKQTCGAGVIKGYFSHVCGKTAKYEYKGMWYCKTHHPPTVKAKNEARNAAWHKEWDDAMAAGKKRELAEAELQRKAAAYDRLSQWLREREVAGISGAPISASEIRRLLEGKC